MNLENIVVCVSMNNLSQTEEILFRYTTRHELVALKQQIYIYNHHLNMQSAITEAENIT